MKGIRYSTNTPGELKDSYPVSFPATPFVFFHLLLVLVFIGGFLKLEGKEWKVHGFLLTSLSLEVSVFYCELVQAPSMTATTRKEKQNPPHPPPPSILHWLCSKRI
jgi:hypothetical protein